MKNQLDYAIIYVFSQVINVGIVINYGVKPTRILKEEREGLCRTGEGGELIAFKLGCSKVSEIPCEES